MGTTGNKISTMPEISRQAFQEKLGIPNMYMFTFLNQTMTYTTTLLLPMDLAGNTVELMKKSVIMVFYRKSTDAATLWMPIYGTLSDGTAVLRFYTYAYDEEYNVIVRKQTWTGTNNSTSITCDFRVCIMQYKQ